MSNSKVHTVKRREDGNPVFESIVVSSSGDIVGFSVLSPDASVPATPEAISDKNETAEFQKWGPDNLTPFNWRMKLEKTTTALPLMAKQIKMQFGRGLVYYQEKREGADIVPDYSPIPEVDDFMNSNDIEYLMLERAYDYTITNNIFVEYILSRTADKIVNLYHLEAEFSRFGRIDPSGKIANILYDGNWASPKTKTDIPFISRRDLNPVNIKKAKKKFVSHDCMPSPGRTLYAVPAHVAIYEDDGWMDYGISIPKIMNTINKNVMDIKWHIRIPYEYWPRTYKNWDELTPDQQKELMGLKLKEMADWLQGDKNAGKAFISHFATDDATGKPLAGWDIIELTSSDKKDKYLTSVQESDVQISRAIGMDTSLSSIQPAGGKMGAGSGSDKRVAHDNAVSVSYADTLILTHPLQVVGNYNGWPPLKWAFRHEVPTTLNENKSGTEEKI